MSMFNGYYGNKDKAKWDLANKFIGYGVKGSSTERYRTSIPRSNCSEYNNTDVVWVSVNGNRKRRTSIYAPVFMDQLKEAVKANVSFITDDEANRNRAFNIGERELAEWLSRQGYTCIGNRWTK